MIINHNWKKETKALANLLPGDVFTAVGLSGGASTSYPNVYLAYVPMSGVGKCAIDLHYMKRVNIPVSQTVKLVEKAELTITY